MIDLSFSLLDLEYFLLIMVRVSCFVFIAPFFSMNNTPAQVRIAISFFTSLLLYTSLTPSDAVVYHTVVEYAVIVGKEAVTGLLIGFSASICTSIVNFAGSIVDMETGLSMVTLMDPTSKEQVSVTGVLYQYVLMMMLIVSGMYRYLLGALADSFLLLPVNGAVIRGENLVSTLVLFMGDYIVIGFRICLPVFCVSLLLNTVLGILSKVSPQLNMFAVGIQFKIIVGLCVLFLTSSMLAGASNFVFSEIKKVTVAFVEGMM
ncbi:MAG TPA: flagellar biosynthetic protein FliR [Lachnospiraceae bacterium]|nr:flagellar biosynthetic protein FliR [Lachnospiraceae bacterium]